MLLTMRCARLAFVVISLARRGLPRRRGLRAGSAGALLAIGARPLLLARGDDDRLSRDSRRARGARAGDRRRAAASSGRWSRYYKYDGQDDFDQHAECGDRRGGVRAERDGAVAGRLRSPRADSRVPGALRPAALAARGGRRGGAVVRALPAARPVIVAGRVRGGSPVRRSCTARAAGWSATCCECSRATGFANSTAACGPTRPRTSSRRCSRTSTRCRSTTSGRRRSACRRRRCAVRGSAGGRRSRSTGRRATLEPACGGGSLQLSVDLPAGGVTRWRIDGDGRFFCGAATGNEEPTGPLAAGRHRRAAGAAAVRDVLHRRRRRARRARRRCRSARRRSPRLSSFDCASAPAVPDDLAALSRPVAVLSEQRRVAVHRLRDDGTTASRQMLVLSDDPNAAAALCDELRCADLSARSPAIRSPADTMRPARSSTSEPGARADRALRLAPALTASPTAESARAALSRKRPRLSLRPSGGGPEWLIAPKARAERGTSERDVLPSSTSNKSRRPPKVVSPGATPSRPAWAWARSATAARRVRSDVEPLRGRAAAARGRRSRARSSPPSTRSSC